MMRHVMTPLLFAVSFRTCSAIKILPALTRMRGGAISAASFLAIASAGADAAAAASPSYHLTNCAAGAAGFFGNVRIPAALLTGAAIGQLWTHLDDKVSLVPNPALLVLCDNCGPCSSSHGPLIRVSVQRGKRVPIIFNILVALSVACEISVVFFSTAISTKMMGSAFDPMATSALALLIREFELPFVACRVHFFVGLLSFVAALALRAWTAFPGALGDGIALLMLSSGFIMNAVFTFTVDNYSFGLLGLIWRYVQLFAAQAALTPNGAAAVIALSAACYSFYKATKEVHEKAA